MSEEKWVWPFSERKHAEILNNSNKKKHWLCSDSFYFNFNLYFCWRKWKKKKHTTSKMRGGRRREEGRRRGRGACQPPASSNYQCEWSVVAGAMGLISALLKETRPCPLSHWEPAGAQFHAAVSQWFYLHPNTLVSLGESTLDAPVPS